MKYFYETHLHTVTGSACATTEAKDYVQKYIDLGYRGIIVTDHFFGGNTSVPRRLSWEKRIEAFIRGYEEAKNKGIQKGLEVFLGWEENYFATEFLIYGLSPQWLKEHPQMTNWTIKEQFEEVTKAGGVVVQAHPFRERGYISHIRLYPYLVHGIEGYNYGNDLYSDAWAVEYANYYNLPITAGTDIHHLEEARENGTLGIALEKPLEDIGELVQIIKNKEPLPLKLDSTREGKKLLKKPLNTKITVFDENEKPMDLPDFIQKAF